MFVGLFVWGRKEQGLITETKPADTGAVEAEATQVTQDAKPAEPKQETPLVTAEDIGKQLAAANKEREELRHKLASIEGSAKSRQKVDDQLARLDKRVSRLVTTWEAYLETGDIEEAKKKRDALTQDEASAAQQERLNARLERLANSIGKKAAKLGIEPTHAKAQEVKGKWEDLLQRNAGMDAFEDLASEWDDFLDEEREKRSQIALKVAQETAKKEYQKLATEKGILAEPVGGAGAPAGANEALEELAKADTRGMTQGQLREHERKLDAALKKGR